ncbi:MULTISPECIES: flagellar hook-associated protein FlgK [Pseudoxanthomonas]|nr:MULTISPECIES: flagellar hook-associated protein FlgK [Pseudoxanthomonas]RRN81236.1 flagellar hook-associated protein FlgK [Pseudoxanthomonas sp. SGD-10]
MNITHIGLSGLLASQAGMDMSARNTANLNTPGYTRQGTLVTARAGGGVAVTALTRFEDRYKSQQVWNTTARAASYSATEPYFAQLEEVMGLEDGSVKGGIDAFFASLDEVSTSPTSVPLRQQVISAAEGLVKRFDSLRQTLYGQLDAVRQQVAASAGQVGNLTATVARLNERIAETAALGGSTSELVDQRDRALTELAGLVEIRVVENGDGTVDVALAKGPPLVAGKLAARLELLPATDGGIDLQLSLGAATFPLAGEQAGGAIGGMSGYASGVLAQQLEFTQALAAELATRVNAGLTSGYGIDGLPGLELFLVDPATGRISVNPDITQARLGFSAVAGEPGNSENLAEVLGVRLQTFALAGLGEVSVGDAYTMMVGQLGSDSQNNGAMLQTAITLRQQAEQDLASVSGVNSEEEVVRISELLQAYQANMKVISVAGEMFDSLIQAF